MVQNDLEWFSIYNLEFIMTQNLAFRIQQLRIQNLVWFRVCNDLEFEIQNLEVENLELRIQDDLE